MNGFYSPYKYEGNLRKLLLDFKYKYAYDIGSLLVEIIFQQLKNSEVLRYFRSSLLIPMPSFKSRTNWRGFNQTELVGKDLAKKLGIKYCDCILRRTKSTIPQVNLSKSDRENNPRQSFGLVKINKNTLRSLNILLFDDIWTTGATIKEATNVLKKEGVPLVWGLTIAKASL